jgi:hypothetical protein
MEPVDSLETVVPLTHVLRDGSVYTRLPAVETRIKRVLAHPKVELLRVARCRDESSEDFLHDEVLVYFIRAYHRADDQSAVLILTEALLARYARWIEGRLRALGLPSDRANDAYQDVVRVVIDAIADLESDRGDHFQVRFAHGLRRKMLSAYDSHLRALEREQSQDSLDSGEEDEPAEHAQSMERASREELHSSFQADALVFENESREVINEALSSIKDRRHRDAFILRHGEGWPITANEPGEACLSKYFRKSPKTIHNWLKQAEADLSARRVEDQ